MKRILITASLITSLTIISGCVTTEAPKFVPSTNEASVYKSRLDSNANDYTSCLIANAAYRKSEKINYTDSDIVDLCSKYRSEFYKSSFYSSFGGYGNRSVEDRYRHATARKDVSIISNAVFRRMKNVK